MIRHNEIEIVCSKADCGGSVVFGSDDIVGVGSWHDKKCTQCGTRNHIRLWKVRSK